MNNIPLEKQDEVIETLAFAYPTWFFEVLTELEQGKPFVLEDFQIDILLGIDHPLSITNKCRQAGGSLIFAAEEFFKAYTQSNYRCDIVSKTLSEATDKISYIKRLWDSLPIRYKKPLHIDNVLSIGFHAREHSLIKSFAPTSSIRGGKKSIIFDEYAHWPMNKQNEIFVAALPAILNGDLSMRIISTPLGDQNMYADIFLNRKNERGEYPYQLFQRHEFIWLDVRRFIRGYKEGDLGPYNEVRNLWYNVYQKDYSKMRELVQQYANDTVNIMLMTLSWEDFLTEMCGSFVNYQDQFFNWDVINKAAKGRLGEAEDQIEPAFEPWSLKRPDDNDNHVVAGIDFGESTPKTDKTVLQIAEKLPSGRWLHRHSMVLDDPIYATAGYTAQTEQLVAALKRFRVNKIIADATTLGGPICEMIHKKMPHVTLDRVIFTNQSKEEMMVNLRVLLESDKLWIQDEDKMLHRELASIRKKTTAFGNNTYSGEPHDDRVMSLALAVRGSTRGHSDMYVIG